MFFDYRGMEGKEEYRQKRWHLFEHSEYDKQRNDVILCPQTMKTSRNYIKKLLLLNNL